MNLAPAAGPVLSYYDDATGEHAALSSAELETWTVRAAGLLRDGCGLGVGGRAALLLPPHWQSAVVLLGAWAAGLAVSYRPGFLAGLAGDAPGRPEPFDATFVWRPRLDNWLDDVPAGRHPFVLGLPPGQPAPAGYRDFLAEVAAWPAAAGTVASGRYSDPASVDGTTFAQWGSLAQELARARELGPTDRLLVDAAEHDHPVSWLLAPLAAGASIVLCANLDPAGVPARMAAEQVTRVL